MSVQETVKVSAILGGLRLTVPSAAPVQEVSSVRFNLLVLRLFALGFRIHDVSL